MKHKQDERGALSMLTVVFLGLILSMITLSFVRLSVSEQRQSTDDALTTRAFYAAESGLEDAKRALQEFSEGTLTEAELNTDVCDPAENVDPLDVDADGRVILSDPLDTGYTCQLINLTPPDYQADLDLWESVTIPLKPIPDSANYNVVIHWHQKGPDPYNDEDYELRSTVNTSLPTYPDWVSSDYPAMLEAGFFSLPRTGTIGPSSFRHTSALLNPTTRNSFSNTPTAFGIPTVPLNMSAYPRTVHNAACQDDSAAADGQYACVMRISISNSVSDFAPASRYNYLHIRALYKSTNIKVSLTVGNTLRSMRDAQAIVDVTGQAGDVFRRVEARVALTDDYPFPDVGLWANEDICKSFTITDNPVDYLNTCSWQP